MAQSDDYYTSTFTLEDKFGGNGLICIIISKQESESVLFIVTWLMSCRVLKRGMEDFVLNTIVNFAKKNEFSVLNGEYIPTPKTATVKEHYQNLGFHENNGQWELKVKEYEKRRSYINIKKTRMDRVEILNQINEVFKETLNVDKLDIIEDTTANDVEEWDSLNHMPAVLFPSTKCIYFKLKIVS